MRTSMRYRALIYVCTAFTMCAIGQNIVINAPFVATPGTQIVSNHSKIEVNSDQADLSNVSLYLTGSLQNLVSGRGGATALQDLTIDGGGNKTFSGVWEVSTSMTFNNGVIVFSGGSSKLTFTKPSGSIGDILVNSSGSYVNGSFYSKGTDTRFFPIGNNSGYMPAILSNVTQGGTEIGMRVINSNPGLTFGADILEILQTHYWELIDPSNTIAGPIVSLSQLNSSGFIKPNVGTVVFGGSSVGSAGVSLDGAANGDYIAANKSITTAERIFTLANINRDIAEVKIHNVVTPFPDNVNDYLQIENIRLFPDNHVRLLDRWGVLVKEWKGFVNVDATSSNVSYDLKGVATGNYICILEYYDGVTTKKVSQMVTIINQ